MNRNQYKANVRVTQRYRLANFQMIYSPDHRGLKYFKMPIIVNKSCNDKISIIIFLSVFIRAHLYRLQYQNYIMSFALAAHKKCQKIKFKKIPSVSV